MELREALADQDDLVVLYVLASSQVNDKTRRFVEEGGVAPRLHYLVDPESRAIDALGLRLDPAEPMEQGVPHPTTLLLDREGRIRMLDVRSDYHVWLDPAVVRDALARVP